MKGGTRFTHATEATVRTGHGTRTGFKWGKGYIKAVYCHPAYLTYGTSPVAQRLKRLPAMQGTWVRSLGWEDPLEKEMATHSSILAWRIPWMEEPGGLQFMGLQRVGHD